MAYEGRGGASSTNNTTTTLLASGATYTGTFEQNDFPNVGVSMHSNIGGTLYFDFSNDGTNVNTFPPAGFTVAAGVHEFHTAVKLGRYFRVRFVMDSGTQTYMRLYTYYGSNFVPSVGPMNFSIADDADAIVTKSVISGVGNTTATVTDHKSLQVTPPAEGKTAFGETLVGQLTPVIQLTFPYNVNSLLLSGQANQSGTATIDTSMLKLSTGAAANSSATMVSNQKVFYSAGLGVRARFTGMFTTGVANATQVIGIGDAGEGFFFGYNGTSFGVLRRYGGAPEIRTLTVSAGANDGTGTDDITITLDGDAKTVTLTDFSGTATITANEIAAADYSDVGRGWTAKAVGATVVFTSWDAAVHTGTYSLVDTDSTGAAGTFAQTLAGAAPTETWVAQASWNGADIFNGSGLTGVTLDPTKLNVFQIDFQYLGAGTIRFYIEDPDDGELHLVHTIEYANANTRPSIDNPTLPLYASVENTSNTSDIVLKSASMGAFIDGVNTNAGIKRGVTASGTLTSTSAETPITTIRVKEVFQSKQNRSKIKLNYISTTLDHSRPCAFNFYGNATLTGASFSDVDATNSTVQQDTSATAFSGGVLLFSLYLGRTGNQLIDLKDDLTIGEFSAGESLTITLAPTSANGAEGDIGINFTEKL